MHLKKCEICGRTFEESDDPNVFVVTGPAQCPYCKEIIELSNFIKAYADKHESAVWNNEIHEKNMIPDGPLINDGFGGVLQSFTLDKFTRYHEVRKRTNAIKGLIERITYVRQFLLTRVEPQFKILDSIYEDKDIFWNEGGNLLYYVNDASLQYVVIKLKELAMSKNSKYSIPKIKNLIVNYRKQIYEDQEIMEVYRFERSGDVMKEKYAPFPINEYLEKVEKVIGSYSEILNAIADVRDNECAHIGQVKDEDSLKKINYCGLKRIFNSLKIIYDGFLFSIAPDKCPDLRMEYDIRFNQLNEAVKYWIENTRGPSESKNKQ